MPEDKYNIGSGMPIDATYSISRISPEIIKIISEVENKAVHSCKDIALRKIAELQEFENLKEHDTNKPDAKWYLNYIYEFVNNIGI